LEISYTNGKKNNKVKPNQYSKCAAIVARKIPCKCNENTSALGILALTYIVVRQ
jgi:hypothetical protein